MDSSLLSLLLEVFLESSLLSEEEEEEELELLEELPESKSDRNRAWRFMDSRVCWSFSWILSAELEMGPRSAYL
jgi:hypothetical protein